MYDPQGFSVKSVYCLVLEIQVTFSTKIKKYIDLQLGVCFQKHTPVPRFQLHPHNAQWQHQPLVGCRLGLYQEGHTGHHSQQIRLLWYVFYTRVTHQLIRLPQYVSFYSLVILLIWCSLFISFVDMTHTTSTVSQEPSTDHNFACKLGCQIYWGNKALSSEDVGIIREA